VGQRWTVDIAVPWELGSAGRQTVAVVALDRASHTVTLQRKGMGDGVWLGHAATPALTRDARGYQVTRQAGRARWYGYATFRNGIVISDELISTRTVTLASDRLGRIKAVERQYILLNAMPVKATR
jgi:hypothetical protein